MEYHACKRDWVAKVVSLIQMLLTFRRRAVSYFSLQSFCTRNPSKQSIYKLSAAIAIATFEMVVTRMDTPKSGICAETGTE